MDAEIRQKLWEEEGVKGWTIAQCKGDAIFIPAGALIKLVHIANVNVTLMCFCYFFLTLGSKSL